MLAKIKEMLVSSVLNAFFVRSLDPKLWVFSSSYNTKFNYNAKYLFDYVFENLMHSQGITPLFVMNDTDVRAALNTQYQRRYTELFGEQTTHEFFVPSTALSDKRRLLSAGVWFTSAGLPVYQGLRKRKRLVINLWHGVPLKKIALREANAKWHQKLFFRLVFSRNYTHVVTNSDGLIPIMSASFAVPESRVVLWGQPRNDVLLTNISSNQRYDLAALFAKRERPLPNYKYAVLYAPTYRDDSPTRLFPFTDYDAATLNAFLDAHEMIILLRCHQSETGGIGATSARVVEFGSDVLGDVNEALSAFDMLVTDYSSIYIDYLLMDRPMVFLPYDKTEYLASRGMNFDYDEVTPGPKPESMAAFLSELEQLTAQREAEPKKDGASAYAQHRKRVNALLNGESRLSCPLIAHEILNKFTKPGGTLVAPLRGKPAE